MTFCCCTCANPIHIWLPILMPTVCNCIQIERGKEKKVMDLQLKHKKNKKKRQNIDKLQKGLCLFCFFFFFFFILIYAFSFIITFLLLGLWIAFNLCFFHMGHIHFAVLIWWCPRLLWKFFSSCPTIWNLEWVDYVNLARCLWFAISILDFWYGIVILNINYDILCLFTISSAMHLFCLLDTDASVQALLSLGENKIVLLVNSIKHYQLL